MTLAEIRERYGVPAEVGMRVSLTDCGDRGVCDLEAGMITLVCKYCGKILGSRPRRGDDRLTQSEDREVACLSCTYQADWFNGCEFWPL